MEGCSVQTLSSVSAINSSPRAPNYQPRRTANFHPSVWGDHFLRYASRDDNPKETCRSRADEEEEHARLKEEVRKMLVGIPDKSWRKLELIDIIQRLGLSYQFETEIETSLGNIYDDDGDFEDKTKDDLYLVALRFRLLRQTGRYVSCDGTFKKFMNSEGKLDESKVSELKGILSLYEASNYRVDGENYLEEAFTFATSKLESMVAANELSNFHAIQVKQALNQPIQKSLTRLRGLQNITIYQEDESHNNALLDLAKLDFNILQRQHQMELCELTKWWNELNCATNFPFARDRLVECYFWAISVYFEPRYAFGRNFFTKIITLSSIMDDMYDAYATLDEVKLFTAAIKRWDIEAINELPMYMRQLYRTIIRVHEEMEEKLDKSGKSYRINYAKEEMKKLALVYIEEANWCQNGHVPTLKECMKVSLVSCGYLLLATAAMVGMGDSATQECFDWVSNNPPILQAASVICRLTDDIVGYESEKERGDVAFCVECYMKEFDVSKEEAKDELWKQVKNAWKDMNREWMNGNRIPISIKERILNLARVMDLLYREEDGYTNSRTIAKEIITVLLVDPIVLSISSHDWVGFLDLFVLN